jgi:DNA ligase-1
MQELQQFIEKMRATSSSTDKVQIIKDADPFIHKVLEYTYNPFKQYYVTSKTCEKNNDLIDYNFMNSDIFELLDSLSNREFTGHSAIAVIHGFISQHKEYKDLIYNIIDKDLKIRAGDKVIRCLAVVDYEGKCTLYSRMGKELTTLNQVKLAIEKTGIINTVFDGEICLMDENGNEDFQGVMKELRRKDHQIENPIFMIFDMIHKPDFDNQKGYLRLSDRLNQLRGWLGGRFIDTNILRYVEQYQITDQDHFDYWTKLSNSKKWEGFMLRKNEGYEGKRTKNLLKVKKFFDAEYEVIDFDIDDHEIVVNGRSETVPMLSQVWIEHKGHKVKVGSGWTHEQRLQYIDGSIVGKVITVQYFEETKNDKGGISLRFPTVKIVHGDKREV